MRRRHFIALVLLAVFYGIAGICHFVFADAFLSIMPGFVPYPRSVVAVTGLCELAGAAGLFFPRFRRAAASGLALYAVCVFPANIQHAINDFHAQAGGLPLTYHVPRLALQPVLVYWPIYAAGLFRRSA